MPYAKIGQDVQYAAQLLQQDQLVAIPTETVYGLAGNALSQVAVARIFDVKDRPSFDPLIIHTSGLQRLQTWTEDIPAPLQKLAQHFMPGPLTLLLQKKPIISDLVTAGSPLVAVRIPAHPLTRQLLAQLDFPLAAPSANPFGYISPTTARHVAQQLGEQIPYILDGGPAQIGLESTIVGMEEERVVVFRKGGIAVEALEEIVGEVVVRDFSTSNPKAPGMLKSHYAPRVPLKLGRIDELLKANKASRVGVLTFKKAISEVAVDRQIQLSPAGDLQEAARRFFAALRELDAMDVDLILAEPLPEQGLGRAINDRLRRAAAE